MIFLTLPDEPRHLCYHVLETKIDSHQNVQIQHFYIHEKEKSYQLLKIDQVIMKCFVAFMNECNICNR